MLMVSILFACINDSLPPCCNYINLLAREETFILLSLFAITLEKTSIMCKTNYMCI